MTNASPDLGDASHYEIRVMGHLDDRWSAWFDGLTVVSLPGGVTVIDCPSLDQAALHGLLRRVRDAGLRLISVARLDPHGPIDPAAVPDEPPAPPTKGATR
jgi:hypothetical protein